ncbi:Alpha/Beta hydrolase protein [Mycena sp. CBHHK59/15]|nr:Alpha/Beta hydrolase protein [Mycena sp. CBHHK59/15]
MPMFLGHPMAYHEESGHWEIGPCPTGKPYRSEFPATTIHDDAWYIHERVLDHLGVQSVAVAIGGSMGGMAILEWPLCTPEGYIRHVIPIATSARHSAWCISLGEAQRQSVYYSDPGYEDGAFLTYRSRDSFESRFGRKTQVQVMANSAITPPASPPPPPQTNADQAVPSPKPPLFSAQSYLRYQGQKSTARFDASCYIHITRKMDTHDVARGRVTFGNGDDDEQASLALARVLSTLPRRALVIGVATDGLFTPSEQRELAQHIPDAELVIIEPPDGHDGFLLEFEQINQHVLRFLKREFPELDVGGDNADDSAFEVKKTSIFGEAEADIVN